MGRYEYLLLRQSSMQHSDPARKIKADLESSLPMVNLTPQAPDVVGFTEVKGRVHWLLRRRARKAGYRLFRFGSVALAVHPRHQIGEVSRVDVLDGFRSPSGKGSHTARGILEVTIVMPSGPVATIHEAHWVTDGGANKNRAEKRRRQSRVLARRVRLHGQGSALAFWMGDTNEDEAGVPGEVQRPLAAAGLVSVYDELRVYPATHGKKTVDVIGRSGFDGRVEARWVRVGPKRHSDHRQVDAYYAIRLREEADR